MDIECKFNLRNLFVKAILFWFSYSFSFDWLIGGFNGKSTLVGDLMLALVKYEVHIRGAAVV